MTVPPSKGLSKPSHNWRVLLNRLAPTVSWHSAEVCDANAEAVDLERTLKYFTSQRRIHIYQ